MCIVQCAVCGVRCAVFSVQCAVCSVQYVLFILSGCVGWAAPVERGASKTHEDLPLIEEKLYEYFVTLRSLYLHNDT